MVAAVFTGRFRLYFNRHGAAPLTWCLSPVDGLWELAVRTVNLNAPSETVYKPKAEADEDDGRPSAWIECEGQLTVFAHGHASIGTP
jgi:hypothetical protein